MSKETHVQFRGHAAHIVGLEPSGLTKKVASSLKKQIKDVFQRNGKEVRVKGMRFIPSTKVDLGQGAFQVMANTVVEVAEQGKSPRRAQSFDSVVTVGRGDAGTGQILKSVKIPALERIRA